MLPSPKTKPRVLLVEDDESNRYAMSRLLETFGLDVVQAASVREAIERLATKPPFVVLDWLLHDGDAAQVMDYMRSQGLSTKIMVVTVAHERRAEISRRAPDGLLTKPFSPEELRQWFLRHGAEPVNPN